MTKWRQEESRSWNCHGHVVRVHGYMVRVGATGHHVCNYSCPANSRVCEQHSSPLLKTKGLSSVRGHMVLGFQSHPFNSTV